MSVRPNESPSGPLHHETRRRPGRRAHGASNGCAAAGEGIALRALITGASGFAGSWLCRACAAAGDEVVAVSRRATVPDGCGVAVAVDLRDPQAVRDAVHSARPDVVYHLAALTSVGRSWEEPARTLRENAQTSVNLLEALRSLGGDVRVVWVSSCEVYGEPAVLPAPEDAALQPANPYAVSKLSAELLAQVYADAHGLQIVRVRPFSHSGPGQRPIFLLSNLAQQAAAGRRAGAARLRIVTGNPDTRRDFTDVRDVVRAYRMLGTRVRRGSADRDGATPGLVYNVSSGVSVSAREQVALLAELIAPIEVELVVDPQRVRAHEVMDLRGDPSSLTAATGWQARIPLRQTMLDTISWWEQQPARAPG
ncbi:MAG TPA: GDP-mannose 4,6-dehydratase [Solirubrobacteraceae bacterium]|nr:GDP-mannose 4,6-dehydratase [Solirubrobacteraceae bacterium]